MSHASQSSFSVNRRVFLKTTGLLATVPLIMPRPLVGAEAPSKKIGIGMIGMGRQAYYANLGPFLKSPDCVVTAVCDVDSWRLEQGLQAVEKHYQKRMAKGYRDFRELLADRNVDAVMISTPDHWHVPMASAAVKAGKDVALEKPITRYINEGRILAALVAKHQRVFRVDSEFRSLEPMHRAAELVRNGRLGKLHIVRTGVPKEVFPEEAETVTTPPPEIDYDLWLGPAPKVDYMEKRVHGPHDLKSRPGWMRSRDYCDGVITNWGTHLNDIAQWGAGTERTGPVEVKATGKFHDGKVWNVLEAFDAWYKFASGLEMFYQMATPHVRFEGEKGWVQVNYVGDKSAAEWLEASDPKILQEKIGPEEIHFPLRSEKTDFIECIKHRGRTLEDEEVGQRTTSLCHLAHIAIQLGGVKLTWDPENETFPGNATANKLINRPPMRAPWKLE
jgi:myo-inositol 2-dehydrogenase / D-chiro-inositol 1-dehydrogenase